MMESSVMSLLSIFTTLTDLAFVIKILVFSYLLYWLFIVFREQQVLLGIVTLIAAYFMFFHAVSITILVLLFFVFIVMSGHFQFIIDMGILPILAMFGFHESGEEAKLGAIQKKLMEGEQLSAEEVEVFKRNQHKQASYEQRAQELLSSGGQVRYQ